MDRIWSQITRFPNYHDLNYCAPTLLWTETVIDFVSFYVPFLLLLRTITLHFKGNSFHCVSMCCFRKAWRGMEVYNVKLLVWALGSRSIAEALGRLEWLNSLLLPLPRSFFQFKRHQNCRSSLLLRVSIIWIDARFMWQQVLTKFYTMKHRQDMTVSKKLTWNMIDFQTFKFFIIDKYSNYSNDKISHL